MPNKYLPIGSIVKVKDIDKKIMITGYYSIEYNNSVIIYDYVGISYPEGLLLKNNSYSFNHSDITSLVFTGYLSSEYNKLNSNLLDQLNKSEDLEHPSTFVNLKFDKNGVVVYEEVSDIKEEAKIVDTLVENPFTNKDNASNNTSIPVVDIKLDSLDTLDSDENAKKDILEIERKFNFTFDENGVVTGEQAVEIPKTEANLKESKYVYEFDENGVVVGVKTIGEEEKPKYTFDEFGRVISEDDKKEEEFVMPHYQFDENGVVIA